MTASTLVTIFCDAPRCGAWEDAGVGDTAALARRGAKAAGWQVNVPSWGKTRHDYCPKHARSGR